MFSAPLIALVIGTVLATDGDTGAVGVAGVAVFAAAIAGLGAYGKFASASLFTLTSTP